MQKSAAALVMSALLLCACSSSKPKLEALPPAQMHEILPPPSVAATPEAAPAAGALTLPSVVEAGTAAGPQVAPTAAPEAPPPAPAGAAAAGPQTAPTAAPQAPPPAAAPQAAAAGVGAGDQFTISLSKSDTPTEAPAAASPDNAEIGWPRTFAATGVAFQVHEPKVQSWDGSRLIADAVVIAQPDGAKQPVPGLIRISARTTVDKAAGTVALEDLTLTDARFPASPDQQKAWLDLLRTFTPHGVKRVSLAHLEASAREADALTQGRVAAEAVVPHIIVARNPVLLVAVDGQPRFVPVRGTNLRGVHNTLTVLLKDQAGRLYLHVYNGWLGAKSLRGPWAIAKAPAGAEQVLRAAKASGRANLLTGKPDASTGKLPVLTKSDVPSIVVSTQPTVLVGVSGEPKFTPIPGTGLEYVSNTKAHIFRESKSKKVYVLAAGHWFEAPASLRGPFELTPVEKLPKGFARIPPDHPKAAIAALVKQGGPSPAPTVPPLPTLVAAPRGQAHFDVVINGDPQLEPIAGTQLNYVADASAPIIQVDINDWYGAQEGVWFRSSEATGPWTVTDHVPPVIYTIPPTAPVYQAIHSRVFAVSKDVTYYGYNPDPFGTTGGAAGVSVEGEDYQTTPPSGMVWNWMY